MVGVVAGLGQGQGHVVVSAGVNARTDTDDSDWTETTENGFDWSSVNKDVYDWSTTIVTCNLVRFPLAPSSVRSVHDCRLQIKLLTCADLLFYFSFITSYSDVSNRDLR